MLVTTVLLFHGSLSDTEPLCFSRWDYEHKMLKQLSKLEDKVDKMEAVNAELQQTISRQELEIQKLQNKGIERRQGTSTNI